MLIFDSTGGSSIKEVTVNEDGKTQIPTTTPTFFKHAFKEWNTNSDGTGNSYVPGKSYDFTTGMTLYAIWNDIYTIEFNTLGGKSIESEDVEEGMTCTIPTTSKIDMVFKGWNTKEDGSGTAYTPGNIVTPASDMTLYAQWTPWGLLNAGVGTKFVYNIEGTAEPDNHAWIKNKIDAIKASVNTALARYTNWTIDFGVDGTPFRGTYVQKITAFNDNGTPDTGDDTFTYSRSGTGTVILEFHISATNTNSLYTALAGDLIKLALTSDTIGCIHIEGSRFAYVWEDCNLIGDADADKTVGLDGTLTHTVAQITPAAETVYTSIENSFLGTVDAATIPVNIGETTVKFTVAKDTLITVKISSEVPDLYSFEASLTEINKIW